MSPDSAVMGIKLYFFRSSFPFLSLTLALWFSGRKMSKYMFIFLFILSKSEVRL